MKQCEREKKIARMDLSTDQLKEKLKEIEQMGLSEADTASVKNELLRIYTQHQLKVVDVVAVELRDEARMRRRAYLGPKKDMGEERQEILSMKREDIWKKVAAAADRGRLTQEEVMTLPYSVFADDGNYAGGFFAMGVLPYQGIERVRRHNFFVAAGQSEAWWILNGETLLSCPHPLFPFGTKCPEFEKLNALLLDATRDKTAGGGTARSAIDKLYRTPPNNDPLGGGYIPITNDPQRQPVVDVTEVETAFNQLLQQQRQLQERMGRLVRSLPTKKRPEHPRRLVPSAKNLLQLRPSGAHCAQLSPASPVSTGTGAERPGTARRRGGIR